MPPRWLHNCSRCVFLGQSRDGQVDLYRCHFTEANGEEVATLIANRGDGESNSLNWLVMEAVIASRHPTAPLPGRRLLLEAYGLAKKQGLLSDRDCRLLSEED